MFVLVIISLSITFYSIINLKTQNLTRINFFFHINEISNTDIYLVSDNIEKINYYSNVKYFELNNIKLILKDKLEQIPQKNLVIIDQHIIKNSNNKYKIIYSDPWSNIIEY